MELHGIHISYRGMVGCTWEMVIKNMFYMEFYNGYIKSTLRLARRVKNAKSLEEAKRIAQ